MQEFFNKIKNANWKNIGHWLIYPPAIFIARIVGGFIGLFMYNIFIFGLIRADVIEYADGAINNLFKGLTIITGSILAGLFTTVNFIPNKTYKHNALYFVAGTALGSELRNVTDRKSTRLNSSH